MANLLVPASSSSIQPEFPLAISNTGRHPSTMHLKPAHNHEDATLNISPNELPDTIKSSNCRLVIRPLPAKQNLFLTLLSYFIKVLDIKVVPHPAKTKAYILTRSRGFKHANILQNIPGRICWQTNDVYNPAKPFLYNLRKLFMSAHCCKK